MLAVCARLLCSTRSMPRFRNSENVEVCLIEGGNQIDDTVPRG